MSKPLTATQIRCLSAGKFIVGGITGLYLKKSSKTSGFFYLRFSDSTGRHEISLGLYPDLSLADARAAAAVARADLARGKAFTCAYQQQRLKRRTAQAAARKKVTFETVARDWIRYQVQHDRWSQNATGERVTTRCLEMYVFPHIGRLSIETVTVKDVARCFVDIWRDKHPVATKTRCIVSKIFQWAIANGIRKNQTNPADTQGGLAVLLEPLSNHLKKHRTIRHAPSKKSHVSFKRCTSTHLYPRAPVSSRFLPAHGRKRFASPNGARSTLRKNFGLSR